MCMCNAYDIEIWHFSFSEFLLNYYAIYKRKKKDNLFASIVSKRINEYTQRHKYIPFCAAIYSFLRFFKAIFYGLRFLLRAVHMRQIHIDNNQRWIQTFFYCKGFQQFRMEEDCGVPCMCLRGRGGVLHQICTVDR